MIMDGGNNPVVRPGDTVLMVLPIVGEDEEMDRLVKNVTDRLKEKFFGVEFVTLGFDDIQPNVLMIYRP